MHHATARACATTSCRRPRSAALTPWHIFCPVPAVFRSRPREAGRFRPAATSAWPYRPASPACGGGPASVRSVARIRASFINIARGRLQARGEARTRLRLNAAAAPSANRRKPQRVCARLSRPQRAFAEPPAHNLSPTPRRIQPPPRRP